MRFILAVILPALILVIPALAAPETTITVCPLGCDFAAIQPAIDAATPGETILVAAGTYTGQLILKTNLTLLAQAGPTQTIVMASASPIISGSNLNAVTLEGLGVTGNETATDLIGIDLLNSSVLFSNTIIRELHGANGTPVYTNGLSAIGLRISGTFSVTQFNSIVEDIQGGDADVDSEGRGGDGIGVSAHGEGQLTIVSSTVRHLVGGAAGMGINWYICVTCCNGAGGRSVGINKEGGSHLRIDHAYIDELVGGQPCTGSYGPDCRHNAGGVIGIRAVSGTLNLHTSVITRLLGQTSYTNIPSIGISTTHSDDVYIADTEIMGLNALEGSLSANEPTSPYCAPPPNSAIGIASNSDDTVQLVRNTLRDIIGSKIHGYSVGVSVRASQAITLTKNHIAQLIGGTTLPWWIPTVVFQVRGIEVSAARAIVIQDNRIEQLLGSDGEPLYIDSSNGGGAVGIIIESAAYSHIINNIIATLVGGHGADVGGVWFPTKDGGAAVGINISSGLSAVWNNTIYETWGGQSGRPNQPAGESIGLRILDEATASIINNILISHTIGVSATASNTLWDYNALWHNTLNYSDVVTGPHDVFADPRFVDVTNGDFHVSFNSPLIDAGFNLGAPKHDFAGSPRPLDGDNDGNSRTDIGAYEYQPVPLNTIFLPIIFTP